MKKYLMHKDFIPTKFVEKKYEYLSKKNNGICGLLIVINLILIPMNISAKIKRDTNEDYNGNIIEVEKNDNTKDLNNIKKYVNINSKYISRLNIEKERAEIILNDDKGIDDLLKLGIVIEKYNMEENEIRLIVRYD